MELEKRQPGPSEPGQKDIISGTMIVASVTVRNKGSQPAEASAAAFWMEVINKTEDRPGAYIDQADVNRYEARFKRAFGRILGERVQRALIGSREFRESSIREGDGLVRK